MVHRRPAVTQLLWIDCFLFAPLQRHCLVFRQRVLNERETGSSMEGWKIKFNKIEEGIERGSFVLSEWKNGWKMVLVARCNFSSFLFSIPWAEDGVWSCGPPSPKVPRNQKILLVTPLQPAVRYEKEKEAISSWKMQLNKNKSMLLHPFYYCDSYSLLLYVLTLKPSRQIFL